MSYMRDAALLKYYRSCAVLRKRTHRRGWYQIAKSDIPNENAPALLPPLHSFTTRWRGHPRGRGRRRDKRTTLSVSTLTLPPLCLDALASAVPQSHTRQLVNSSARSQLPRRLYPGTCLAAAARFR